MQGFLELGAGVSYMEPLLANGVITMEKQQHGVTGRIDLLSGLEAEQEEENSNFWAPLM